MFRNSCFCQLGNCLWNSGWWFYLLAPYDYGALKSNSKSICRVLLGQIISSLPIKNERNVAFRFQQQGFNYNDARITDDEIPGDRANDDFDIELF